MTREDIKTITDIVHKTIYQFFDVCSDDEEVPMSDKDNLLLEVNKALCNNIKALEQEPKTGHWIYHENGHWNYAKCSECKTIHDSRSNYCPFCGAGMDGYFAGLTKLRGE